MVQLCEHRVVSRLKCKDWVVPAYHHGKRRDPIHEDLKDVVDRHLRQKGKQTDEMRTIESRLQVFIRFMTEIDRDNSAPTFGSRLEALRLAGKVCDVRSSLETAFKQAGTKLDIAGQKVIKAFDKLANYQHISERLSRMAASSSFRYLFKSIHFRFLDHYESHIVHERERYVHAEVQLAIFHRLQRTHPSPRTIGTTKAACYLCNLFLSHHPQYTISATHGVIFNAWTIPDVISYSAEDRRELRSIVRSMQDTLAARAREGICRFLQFPVQSGIYHVPSLPSLVGTVIAPAASVVGESLSTVPTDPENQGVVETSLVASLAKAVTIPLADHHSESSLEIIIKTPSQQSEVADEQYSMDEKSKLENSSFLQEPKLDVIVEHERGIEIEENPECHTEAKLDVSAVSGEVSRPQGELNMEQDSMPGKLIHDIDSTIGLNSERVFVSELSQIHCTVDTSECAVSSREPNGKNSESSHEDTDSGCEGTVHLSSARLDCLANLSIPVVIKPDPSQDCLGGAEQQAQESPTKHPRKKRHRRRHSSKSHHRSGRDDSDIFRSRHSGSGHYTTPRGSKKRRYYAHESSKTTQRRQRFTNSRSTYSFVQGLLRVVRRTKRLFCG